MCWQKSHEVLRGQTETPALGRE